MSYNICGCLPTSYVFDPAYNMILLQDLKVGDSVLGVFGNVNTVKEIVINNLGLDFMTVIDGNLTCLERSLFWNNAGNLVSPLGVQHIVRCFNCPRFISKYPSYGNDNTNPHFEFTNIKTFSAGDSLYFLNNFSRKIKSVERTTLPDTTQVYTVILDGDHTCFMNGYAMLTKQAKSDD